MYETNVIHVIFIAGAQWDRSIPWNQNKTGKHTIINDIVSINIVKVVSSGALVGRKRSFSYFTRDNGVKMLILYFRYTLIFHLLV